MIRIVRICRQGFFMGGLILTAIYGVAYKLWPIMIPMIAEVALMTILIILKFYFDNFGPKALTRKENETQHANDTPDKAENGCVDSGGCVGEDLKE